MQEDKNKRTENEKKQDCACGGNCQCEDGQCQCSDQQCCGGQGCGCGIELDEGIDLDEYAEDLTPAEQYAMLGEEAYKELVKEKLKQKFTTERNQEIEKVAELAYQATILRWKEINNESAEYDAQAWDTLDQELSKLWK